MHTQVSVGLESFDGSRSVGRLDFVTKSVDGRTHIGSKHGTDATVLFYNINVTTREFGLIISC